MNSKRKKAFFLRQNSFFSDTQKGCAVRLFYLQETGFTMEAGGIAGEGAVGADDAVAGDDEGDGVVPHRSSHCLSRHRMAGSPGGDNVRDICVCHRLAIGDGE